MPGTLEAYYQEAGRGGRDGKRSFAVLLFRESDAALPQGLIAESHPELRVIREVYSAVASVAQIPLGGVFEEPIMLDHDTISSQVGCSRAMVRASVDQLVRQEIWERLPGGVSRGFVRMNMTTADVRHYIHSLQNRHLAEFVDLLMRRLSAEVFFEWIDIDLALLGRDIGMPVERISDGLHFLAGQDVLSYRAPDDGERIRFLEPRTRLVSLAGKAMSRSRKRSTSKFRHMLRYARSRTCRRHLLLGYFGERASVPCGACDVCLGRHQTPVITSSDEADLIALLKAIDTGAEGEDGNSGHVVRSVREESLLAWLVQEGYVEYPDLFEERPEITEKAREWLQQRPGKS